MRDQVRTFILLTIVLAALGIYAVVPLRLTYAQMALRKITLPFADDTPTTAARPAASTPQRADSGSSTTLTGQKATTKQAKAAATKPETGKTIILFFGDSMLEELTHRLDDYAAANGYTMQTVIWYGSSTEKWGMTQTLRKLIDEYKPTYLWLCLGSNELFVRDLEERDAYIKLLLAQTADLPFVWIGPPNWKQDTGIDQLIRENVGDDHYFDSSQLKLKRKKDGRHPTREAAAQWGDAIATWMQSRRNANPLPMRKPRAAAHCPVRIFQPTFEGYS